MAENAVPGKGMLMFGKKPDGSYAAMAVGASGSLQADTVYTLLSNASATGPILTNVIGGSYVWIVQGTIGGATIKLQALGPDGVNWVDIDTWTGAVGRGVVIGNNASLRALVSGGAPSGLYCNLS